MFFKLNRKYIKTADGSSSIYVPDLDETYHSRHGAINEAVHVFIKSGFLYFLEQNPEASDCSILEIGFGTGLNAFLTAIESEKLQFKTTYIGVEAYPILNEDLSHINFQTLVNSGKHKELFYTLHKSKWEQLESISGYFQLKKLQKQFSAISDKLKYNLIYFDAFGPRVQPNLWEEPIFNSMYNALKPGGVLVTYCAQGQARRTMQSVGFLVERIAGPPGKREMLRATKPHKSA